MMRCTASPVLGSTRSGSSRKLCLSSKRIKKKALLATVRFRSHEVRLTLPPLRHRYLDERAVRSVRRQKRAAGDREIDLLLPFVAAKMQRDVPNFVVVRGQGPGVGNEW